MIVSRRNSIFFSVLAGLLLFSLASNHFLSLEDRTARRRYDFAGDWEPRFPPRSTSAGLKNTIRCIPTFRSTIRRWEAARE